MSGFSFEVLKHYNNLEIQIKVQCEEPFCPFQNTKLCKRNILKSVLQRRGVTISEVKLTHGEYMIQCYLSKKQFDDMKPIFKNIDEHVEQVRQPNVQKMESYQIKSGQKKTSKAVLDELKPKSKPKRRSFNDKETIFKWIKQNYNSVCTPSNVDGQYFMVNDDKVVGYIILSFKNKKYSVKELNLVDADLKLE